MLKSFFKFIYIISGIFTALFLLSSCKDSGACTKINVSVEESLSDSSTDTNIYGFSTKYEALKILSEYIDMKLYPSHYEEASYNEYIKTVDEVREKFEALDFNLACEYIILLQNAYKSIKYMSGDIPQIYIETNGEEITSEYISAKIAVINPDNENNITEENVLIKIRGQSTASAPKKPYTFKYEKKISLLGMSSGKRWILLANAFDKTLMRNKLVFDFCRNLSFEYTPDSRYAELWCNGEFQGNYLLTQAITDDKNRIPINKSANEFMIEIERDRYEDNITYIKTELYGIRFKIIQPEIPSSSQADYLKSFMEDMENAIASKNHEVYQIYIDINSFIDYNIVLNYFKDVDAEYSSTNFYLKDGKLYAGPPWDFDLAIGNVNSRHNNPLYFEYNNSRGYGNKSGESRDGIWADCIWFKYLLEDEYYYERLKERYKQLQPLTENLYTDNYLGKNRIDILLEEYEESFNRNYSDMSKWKITDKFSEMERYAEDNYTSNVNYLKTWLKSRNEWLIKEYFAEE